MYRIKGKYNEAQVYASNADALAVEQLTALCDMEVYRDCRIRVMPDVHAGAGCTIGTTMTIHDAVTPNMVGVDIGCGMETVQIEEKEIDLEKLDEFIKKNIPAGRNIRKNKHPNADLINVDSLRWITAKDHLEKELKAVGTLGGGNHFIEVDKDAEGNLYIVIHSGSRHLGKETAEFYQKKAYKQTNGVTAEEIQKMINDLKSQGRQKEIEATIQEMKQSARNDLPQELCYVTGELFEDYIHDMKIMQHYAEINRKTMMEIILKGMNLTAADQFTTIHNYIDTEHMILRKGAVSARKGEKLLIPINMRDGSLICIGKGNPDWNESAPHGAGRVMSRKEAFRRLSVEDFTEQMQGIYTTTATRKTLDESPMAYKDMTDIVNNIGPTGEIIRVIRPVYNFKAEN